MLRASHRETDAISFSVNSSDAAATKLRKLGYRSGWLLPINSVAHGNIGSFLIASRSLNPGDIKKDDLFNVLTRLACTTFESKEAENCFRHADMLTGIPNRHLLSDRLVHAIAFGDRKERGVGVVFFDRDNLKTIKTRSGTTLVTKF